MPKRKPTVKAGATFFRSYIEAVEDLSEEHKKEWCYAIINRLFYGIYPDFIGENKILKGYWKLIEPNLNTSVSRSNTKQLRGNQKGTKKEPKENQMATNDLLEDKDKDNIKKYNKESIAVSDNIKLTINNLFKRRPSTQWSDKEVLQLKKLMKRTDFDKELAVIERLYQSEYKYKRRDIQTLLNNWTTEMDRAASYFAKQEPAAPGGWDARTREAIG